MGLSVPLRTDFDTTGLRCLARKCGDNRLTLRDWVHRFNEQGPDGLTNKEGAGRPRLITNEQMQELARIVEAGPGHRLMAWFAGGRSTSYV